MAYNKKKFTTYKGISRYNKSGGEYYYIARIKRAGKRRYIGMSKDETEAAIMYDNYIIEHWKELFLNFPYRKEIEELENK